MTLCQQGLVYLGLALGTLFWCLLLVEERRFFKRKRDKWWNRDLVRKNITSEDLALIRQKIEGLMRE